MNKRDKKAITLNKRKYKRKIKKYKKTAKRYITGGVAIWNRLNTPANKKKMAKLGKRAYQMQQNILNNIWPLNYF